MTSALIVSLAVFLGSLARAEDPSPGTKAALPIAELKRDSSVDFEKEILPALRNNCLACHNTTKAKAGLNLETPQLILKGGDSGPGVVPGKSTDSLVFKAAAHLDPENIMPPKDNKANASNFKPSELALLKLWIEQGAKGEVLASSVVNWLENPPVLDPILSLDVTPDGQFAACSRGSRVDVYHVPSGRRMVRLTDSRLDAFGLTNAAHRDLVNAVAFHPNGSLLATAGYRDVKLWRRTGNLQERTLTNAGSLFAVSPDRKWLAAAAPGLNSVHAIQLVDIESDSVVRVLTGHSNSVAALSFSPDQRHLASVSSDQTVRVWTVADGTLAAETTAPTALRAVTWLTDSSTLAFGGDDGVVRVAALTNLAAAKELKGHTGAIAALAGFTQGNTNTLVSAGADGLARLWDLAEGKVRHYFTQQVAVAAIAVRPDGKRIATAGTNAIVRLWNAESGALIAELKGDRYADEKSAERDRALVVAKADAVFHKKAVETAEAELKKAEARVAKATETNTVTEKVFLEKEKASKTAAEAKGAAGKALQDLLAEIQRVTESYEKAAQASKEATTFAADASTRATETQLAADRATQSKADAERIATDSASVASRTKATVANADAAKDTARRIADESSSVAEKSRAFADAVAADASMKLQFATEARAAAKKAIEEVATKAFAAGQLKPVYDKTLAEAPEKRKQATNLVDSTTKSLGEAEKELQRAETRKSVAGHELELATAGGLRASNTVAITKATFTAAETAEKEVASSLERAKQQATMAAAHPTQALAFSPDGRTLATLMADGRVRTWSGETGAAFDVLPPRPADRADAERRLSSTGLAFLGRDRLLAPSDADHRAVAWNLNPKWTLERTLGAGDADSLFADRINAVRFSPDGRVLATGGGEPTRSGEVKLFTVADGQTVRSFSDVHSDAVLSVDFSPDGKYLASSSADRFVKVVDLATGKVVRALEGHTSYVLGVAWKRDSRTLASAGADKVIKVWDFVTGDRRKNIEGADKDVTGIAFVGVSDQMIATSGDSQVRLLKENGEKVRSFEGATDFMNSTAATPDGKIVIAGGQDGRLHIWNGTDGKKVASFAPEE